MPTRIGKRIDGVGPGVMEALLAHDWPGNVRELENTIERAVVLSTEPVIARRLLPTPGQAAASDPGESAATLPGLKLHANLEWVERETVKRALSQSGGVKKDAAETHGHQPARLQLLPLEAPHRVVRSRNHAWPGGRLDAPGGMSIPRSGSLPAR